MIFGEEGERLAQQRAAAQRQYAEDLKAQIAEKNNKGRNPDDHQSGPDSFSIGSAPPRPPSLLQQVHDSHTTSVQNISRPTNNINQPGNQPRTMQNNSALRPNSPHYEPLPDLPPVSVTGPSPDAIRFADRLNWLETSVDQHQSILKAAADSATRIERNSLPSLNDGVEQLRAAIDRVSTVDLPARLRPIEDENQRLEEKITQAAQEFSNATQSLRDRLGETSSVFSQTQSKFAEFSNSVKSTILEFKAEIAQARDAHDAVAQRIAQAESRASQTEESLRAVATALQNFEKSASDGINNAQQATNNMVQNAALQIAQALKTESEGRDQASSLLHSQTEEVNQRAASSASNIQNVINDLALSFKQSLSTLSSSVKDALESTRTESDNQYRDLTARLDKLLSDTDNNFATVQNESVATLQSLNEHATKAREELENALTQECEIRKKNEQQIVQRYDNFKSLIINEMQMQTEQMEEMSLQATQKVTQICNDAVLPLKNEIAQIRDKTKGAETLSSKVSAIEHLLSQINSQLVDNVGAIGQKSSTIVTSIDKMKRESDQAIEQLSERVKSLEDTDSNPDYVTRTDVSNAFANLNSEFDNRMKEIEQQLGVIFSSISDLTMNISTQPKPLEPGSQLLEDLANEDKKTE